MSTCHHISIVSWWRFVSLLYFFYSQPPIWVFVMVGPGFTSALLLDSVCACWSGKSHLLGYSYPFVGCSHFQPPLRLPCDIFFFPFHIALHRLHNRDYYPQLVLILLVRGCCPPRWLSVQPTLRVLTLSPCVSLQGSPLIVPRPAVLPDFRYGMVRLRLLFNVGSLAALLSRL